MRWPALRAGCVMSVLIFTGCADEVPSASSPDGNESISSLPVEADGLVCQRDDGAQSIPDIGGQIYSPLASAASKKTLFRCLRFLSATDISRIDHDMQLVNIGLDNADAALTTGQLRIPLHEIKTKAFLRDRSIAIISNGRQFAALEKECTDIRASGIDDVIAVLPTAAQLTADRDGQLMNAPKMKPQEFISERAYGVWHFVNLTDQESLESPLFVDTNEPRVVARKITARGSTTGLVRTLVVFDSDAPSVTRKGPRASPIEGQTFVLEGGLAGLQRYEVEATAMALALARPRINERGCS